MSNKLWERQAWDDDLTFGMFCRWLLMTPRRDLVEAWRQHSESDSPVPLSVRDAYAGVGGKPSWEVRARAYDVDEEEKGMLYWAAQRKVVRQIEYEVAMDFMNKVRELIKRPMTEIVIKAYDDKGKRVPLTKADEMTIEGCYEARDYETLAQHFPDIHISIAEYPAKWALRDLPKLAETASSLARLAAEMEQNIQKMVFVLSPEAIAAIKQLEAFGVQYHDVVSRFERDIIEMPKKYERLQDGHSE